MSNRAHQSKSRKQLAEYKRLWNISIERYQGKLALLHTYEQCRIENECTDRLRAEIRRLRQLLENKGAL